MKRKHIAQMFGVLIFFMGAIIIMQTISMNAIEMQGFIDHYNTYSSMTRTSAIETTLRAGLGCIVCALGLWIYVKKE